MEGVIRGKNAFNSYFRRMIMRKKAENNLMQDKPVKNILR